VRVPIVETFVPLEEEATTKEFLDQGYIIRDVADRDALDEMRHRLVLSAVKQLGCSIPADDGTFLDQIHEQVPLDKLNALRLGVYRDINSQSWFRPTYFRLGRPYIETLVGNELAMQNRINLSVQMPEDRSSLLDLHADVFSGETPYQVVQWLPLVSVYRTKSMFILARPRSLEVVADLKSYEDRGMAGLYEVLKNQFIFLDIPYGKILIFSPNCLHGNTINDERTTRWSFNTRFLPLLAPTFSPEKSLGSFYLPITLKATTRIGMSYEQPTGFEE
jgi:sporadic carbohydrate cluster 2OG-Fe(II) oxygenase